MIDVMDDDSLIGTQCETLSVGKWHNNRTPDDGAPDEYQVVSMRCFEQDGRPVFNQERMRRIRERQVRQANGQTEES